MAETLGASFAPWPSAEPLLTSGSVDEVVDRALALVRR
jgi:hypothetical protein